MNPQKKRICTISLVAVNIMIFFALSFFGMTEDGVFMLEHGAMYVPYMMERGEYYRLFTSMFLHFGFTHLMNNMLVLFLLGNTLEEETGAVSFLLIYFMSGLGGNLLSGWSDLQSGQYTVSAGASGAIFGIIGALLYIAIRNKGRIGNISGRGILFMIACSLYHGFASSGIDNMAHIGGLLTGFAAAVILYRKRYGNTSSGMLL